ncbi:two-component system, OmpR family, sensor histidine kinase KdpD [Aneurinibacillus thermoaerophilus]|uniref:Two-component system, OmpR family, sensor histidine kinase KdpD n=1 Tax=Aneurinibacillus thermoaerophilus TaxID=143495 RepID=A0A1G7ZPB3_ANETH|nr:universal stress protein [Aneurinibacillus thermoaerophilus]SDH10499.1 two-component system, OmpR family, sensor histidine kinase KdpD [Aneurinibacillus thermoaerophilus]
MKTSAKKRRETPEELLKRIEKESRGYLKIFIGAAPGVGKTYMMLREGNELLKKGVDIIIGIIETHGRAATAAQIENLPIFPLKKVDYKNKQLKEFDLEGILERKPQYVIVDELAHTNVPGSKNQKRYEDVMELVKAGINVMTAVNIQHLESLNDTVEQLTGIKVRERIPDWMLNEANEIQLIDTPPETLCERLKAGLIYQPEKIEQSLKNFFRIGNLNALREIALREVADDVDERLESYKLEKGINGMKGANEKILVCVNYRPNAERLIRRGWRIASRLKCQLYILNIPLVPVHKMDGATRKQHRLLEKLAKDLDAEFHIRAPGGRKPEQLIIEFVEEKGITQVVLGQSARSRWEEIIKGSIVTKIMKGTKHVDILIVADGVDHRE